MCFVWVSQCFIKNVFNYIYIGYIYMYVYIHIIYINIWIFRFWKMKNKMFEMKYTLGGFKG